MPDSAEPGGAASRETRSSMLSGMRLSKEEAHRRRCQADFFDKYRSRLVGYFKKAGLDDEDAQDLASNLALTLIDCITKGKFGYKREKGRFRDYLSTCAVNAVRKFWRKNSKRQIAEMNYVEQEAPAEWKKGKRMGGVSVNLDEWIDRGDLERRLCEQFDLDLLAEAKDIVQRRVTKRDWMIFHRLTATEIKANELASQLGAERGAIYQAKSRVMAELRQELDRLRNRSPNEDD